MSTHQHITAFVKQFLHLAFELRSFGSGLEMLSHSVSWIGVGKHEVCNDFHDALRLFSSENKFGDTIFKICNLRMRPTSIDELCYSVMGEFTIEEHCDNTITNRLDLRFTMICRLEDGELKVLHNHFSAAAETPHSHDSLPSALNIKLEQQLEEHTRKLRENTEAMEALLSNLTGGVVVCQLTGNQPITYHNDGFCELTGYTSEELEILLDNQFLLLVAPEYVEYCISSMQHQQVSGARYELEYPIICRDGSKIWVLDKGSTIRNANGDLLSQSILTDITSRKQLENDLRQQNEALTLHKHELFEANVTRNTIIQADAKLAHELNLPSFTLYADLVRYLTGTLVHHDDQDNIELFFSVRRSVEAMEHGEIQRSIKFQLYGRDGVYRWKQADITSVRDDLSGDIKLRCYIQDIHDKRHKLDRSASKQRIIDYVLTQSSVVYEVNLTTNKMLSGTQQWLCDYGIDPTSVFSDDIELFARRAIHPDDAGDFIRVFRISAILSAFDEGRSDLCCEYRKLHVEEGYRWFTFTLHLFEDDVTGELRAVGYVQDIHDRKLRQLELVYNAEHDQLTGLLNKTRFEQLVDGYLSGEGKGGKHAFFIFDLDCFKTINDSLGHAFGDVVLSRTATRAVELFREHDLLGRVGGDEFAIFMKNMGSIQVAESKANELCGRLHDIYNQNGIPFPVSVSVGIAFYPMHGVDHHDLYRHSDIALYAAKDAGRNRSMIYNESLAMTPSLSTVVDFDEFSEPHSFDRNISEFVFRILYDTPDKCTAIHSVLELIGKQYGVSRSYVFEENITGTGINNTFEWCTEGIASQLNQLQELDYTSIDEYPINFNEAGIYYAPDITKTAPNIRTLLETQGIVSMLQFSILRNDNFYGFVGFDFCDRTVVPTKSDISVLKTVANMLGVFLTEMRAVDISEKMSYVAMNIVDALDSYAYIIDPTTYRLLLLNKKTRSLSPTTITGDYCYRAFMGAAAPCVNCAMNLLDDEPNARASVDVVNPHLNKNTRATASWLDWTDGSRACLIHCIEL